MKKETNDFGKVQNSLTKAVQPLNLVKSPAAVNTIVNKKAFLELTLNLANTKRRLGASMKNYSKAENNIT